MKPAQLFAPLLILLPVVLGRIQPAQAQVVIQSTTSNLSTSVYSTSSFSSYPNLKSGSSVIIQPASSVVIVNPVPSSAVIVIPTQVQHRRTKLYSPLYGQQYRKVIINTQSRQCGTAIIGSPIPSPIPVDIYGQSCRY